MFGLRGECKIDATRLGTDALAPGTIVHVVLADGSRRPLRIRSSRMHKGRPLAAFEGFDDVDAVATLVGAKIALDRADVVLAPGEFLDTDLIGCECVDATGVRLGRVVGVEHYPAQDMLVVGATRALVPMVREFVQAIDIASGRITVNLPRGLLDDREADRG